MRSEIVDGQDVDAVFDVVGAAVSRARAGEGPTLVEAKTYRFAEHAANMGRVLLERGPELEEWLKRDPIELYRLKLIAAGTDADDLIAIETEIDDEIVASLDFARNSPYPEQSEAFTDVFTEPVPTPAWLKVVGNGDG